MSYTPTVFSNGQAPGLSATEMNKIGNGIKQNADDIAQLQSDVSDSNEDITKNTSDISELNGKVTKNTNDITSLNENLVAVSDKVQDIDLRNKCIIHTNTDKTHTLEFSGNCFTRIPIALLIRWVSYCKRVGKWYNFD